MANNELKEITDARVVLTDILTGAANYENTTFSWEMVSRLLDTNGRKFEEHGREKERDELVCRLIASGMSVEDISVILNIRIDDVRVIESNYVGTLIPEYAKTLKSRRKYREKKQ